MKKILLVIIGLAILLAAGFFFFERGGGVFGDVVGPPPSEPEARKAWLSENIKGMSKTFVLLDEKLPSWKELDEMNESLSVKRNYPRFIKAVQTYGTTPNLVEVLYFGDVLKDMGVNT